MCCHQFGESDEHTQFAALWTAPEVFHKSGRVRTNTRKDRSSHKSDVWSFGEQKIDNGEMEIIDRLSLNLMCRCDHVGDIFFWREALCPGV